MNTRKSRKYLAGLFFDLQKSALNHGLISGGDDYCKFVIISRGRTGSTLLRTALTTHSQIMMFGELFRIPGRVGWSSKFGSESYRAQELASQEPADFLRTSVFRAYPKRVKAVGFKIFYYHAEKGNWKQAWTYLKEQKDLHIIHNKRGNILKTQLSDKRAWQTGQWSDKSIQNGSYQSQTNSSLKLEYDELVEWFELTREWENAVDSTFVDHPKIDVYYEDLANDYAAELGRIQDFLNLERQVIEPATRKQARGKLSEQISNYADLKIRFKGTPWSLFFEE